MKHILIQLGTLECRYNKDLGKYEILHRLPGGSCYVALYIYHPKNGDEPSFETVGSRPWTAEEDGNPMMIWPFARACASFIQMCLEE